MCQNYKSQSGCTFGDKCLFRNLEVDRQPNSKSKKSGGKGSVALLKESIQLGCVSPDYSSKKSILRKLGNIGSSHTVNFSKGTWHHEKKGKEKVHRKELFKSASLKKAIRVRQNLRKDTSGNLATASMRPQRSMGFRETCLQSQSNGPGHVPLPYRSLGNTGTLFEKARGARIRGGFRSINAHAEQKGFEPAEMETIHRSRNPTTEITANGEVHTNEEATVYGHDLDLFVATKILEDTPTLLGAARRTRQFSLYRPPRKESREGSQAKCKIQVAVRDYDIVARAPE